MKKNRLKPIILKVPYLSQGDSYTCGPVTLQMVLRYYGLKITRKSIIRQTKANPKTGSNNSLLVQVARRHGFKVSVGRNATFSQLESWIDRGIPVIINYLEVEKSTGHYAVIVGYTPTHFIAHDPWHGARIKISRIYLSKNWVGGFTKARRWFMATYK